MSGLAKHLERTRGLSPMAAAQLADKIIREKAARSAEKKIQREAPQMSLGLDGIGPETSPNEPDEEIDF